MIKFGADICSNFDIATNKEWLYANELGGFASSSIIGCNTRRYHGLLVASLNPPTGRTMLLSRFEEDLYVGDLVCHLSTSQYTGAIAPTGYRFQQEFELEPFPTFRYSAGGVKLEKQIFMPHGQNITVISYRLLEPADNVHLSLRPFVGGRDFHHLTRPGATSIDYQARAGELQVSFGWGAQLCLYFPGEFRPGSDWYYNYEYEREKERGLDFREDLFFPGTLDLPLSTEPAYIVASAAPVTPQPAAWREQELARRQALVQGWAEERPEIRTMVQTADSLTVQRADGLWGVIAGYHWFEDWGRDSMISLPGLCMALGKLDVAKAILLAYARACKDGMLPNRFVEADGHPEYNTVDAALWFVNAMRTLAQSGEREFAKRELLPAARQIVERYYSGTHYGIHADSDGLIEIGPAGGQLTWMDAKVGDWVVTPRFGKPVEIQALWYNALRTLEEFGITDWQEVAERARQSFTQSFWNEAEGCLYDRLTPEGPDGSIRPNQVIAAAFPYPILADDRAGQMLAVVERELLTPYGLRTLSPRDSRYRGRYEGDVYSRDGAYHQGTVWPWPLGSYLSAYLRLNGFSPEAQAHCRELLEPLLAHLSDAGLGSVSEIFDGDPPHTQRGCISQAWSVAEILRVWLTELR